MGSATRAALANARAALDAERSVSLTTGEQLLAASRTIAGSLQLRAVLSDPSIDATSKTDLLTRVFGRLDPAAATLLGALVAERWSTQDQLVDGVEEIGLRAIAAAAGADSGVEAELFSVARLVAADPELELALGSKLGDADRKAALVDALLAGKASPAALVIVRHLVQSPRGRRIGELLGGTAEIVADAAGRIVATVTAAAPLTPAQLTRLERSIVTQYGREARIDLVIDPAVLGGLRVQVGDEVVDGTIAARLSDLRLQLAG